MKSPNDEIVEQFRETAQTLFSPLAEKYGLKFLATGLTEYSIPVKDVTVRVRLILSHIPDPVVAVFGNDPKWLAESPLRSWGVNLLKFVEYQDADFNFADARLSNRADLRIKMALLAELLVKYCGPLLLGDMFLWRSVASRAEEEVMRKITARNQ